MKKWITVDAFIVAFLSAIASGFGYSIPCALNAPDWLCIVISIAVVLPLEFFAEKIVYSQFTQEKNFRKYLIFAAFIGFYLICDYISKKCFESSLFENLTKEFGNAVFFSALGFVFSFAKHYYKTAKVRKRYGNGEAGFLFNAEEKARIKARYQRNTEIIGNYAPDLAAKTRTGVYVGVKEDSVLSFNGIPYAKAPVGDLRWKAPERLPDSEKVYKANYFGASSIQVSYEGNLLSSHQQSEDCLTLNICTTKLASREKKPVVVYFHGGDFTYGGSADPLWEMSAFVKEHPDVVAVSFNYRLGLLGFIDFSAVSGGEEYPDAINLGLLDQIAALEWVKENIAAFGGDAGQITVMGDGAGGISISLLSAAPRARGLFQKAILLSGSPFSSETCRDASAMLGSELMKASGAADMKELLSLPESRLVELTQELKEYLTVPVCDGKLIPENVFSALENGAAKDISFVLCTSRDNIGVYSSSIGRAFSQTIITDIVEKILEHQSPENAQKLRKKIAGETERIGKAKAEETFCNLWLDNVGVFYVSESLHTGGSEVRLLYWDVDAVIKNLGVGDVSLVSAVLDNPDAAQSYGSVVDEAITEVLQTAFLKFVHGKTPALYNNEVEGVNAVRWETFPGILAISNNKIQLKTVEDTLKEAKEILQTAGLEE